jgi:hypothetical protein
MGLDGFIPEIWSGTLFTRLEKAHVFGRIANRNYEGDIRGEGDVVKINMIGDINVSTYSKNNTTLTVQTLDEAQRELKIDQVKYFDFVVDDVDQAQTRPKVMQAAMQRAAYKLRDTSDVFIAAKWADAGIIINNAGAAYSITSVNITEYMSLIAQKMSEVDVPAEGRWLAAPPWWFSKLSLAKIALDTNNSDTLANGFRGRYLGFDLYESNNVVIGTPATNALCRIMAGDADSITFAEQITKVEAYRSHTRFADEVRGLYIYGAKVARPESLAMFYATYAAG